MIYYWFVLGRLVLPEGGSSRGSPPFPHSMSPMVCLGGTGLARPPNEVPEMSHVGRIFLSLITKTWPGERWVVCHCEQCFSKEIRSDPNYIHLGPMQRQNRPPPNSLRCSIRTSIFLNQNFDEKKCFVEKNIFLKKWSLAENPESWILASNSK